MYKRTHLGNQEITNRELGLPARVRTLLLLIESQDLTKLDQRIMRSDYLETLLNLGLIVPIEVHRIEVGEEQQSIRNPKPEQQNKEIEQGTEDIHTMLTVGKQPVIPNTHIPQVTEVVPQPSALDISLMSFDEIKFLMQHTLKDFAGLLGKNLIEAIEYIEDLDSLRKYQKKWLTLLFETNISRKHLSDLLQIINHNLQRLESRQ